MKKLTWLLTVVLCICLLAGCMGTPVIYNNCTCPSGGPAGSNPPAVSGGEGALKLGLAITTDISGSKDAGEKDGEAKYDVTMMAVLIDDDGIIRGCAMDGVSTSVRFDALGQLTSDLSVAPQTKNELGDKYGMVALGNAKAEWNKQAEAFCNYVIGKTVAEVKGIAVDEGSKPTDADLSASVTIAIGGFQALVEKAAANAKHLGTQAGETLKLAATCSIAGSKSHEGEKPGMAQLDVDVAAMTMDGETITACTIDSVQAKVEFIIGGTIQTDSSVPVQTKTELGDKYGMVALGGAKAEWYRQVESFCRYVTGKTVAQVKGIAVNEGTKPVDSDLSASVTIAIGNFQALIEKAAK